MLKKEYRYILFFLIVVSIFFYQFFLGKIPFPGDLLAGQYNPWRSYSFLGFAPGGIPNKAQYFDVLRQLYPWKQLAIESFKQFSIPLWNPYNFSGTPFLANNQSAVWYPFNFFYFLFPQHIAWGILVLLQPLLASVGTYLFARKIGIGKWGSLLSGIAYGFCLYQSVFLEYNTMGHVIALLPWTLLGIELLVKGKRMWGSLLFVLSLVFSFFAGHIQLWGFSMVFILCYVFFRLFYLKKKVVFGLEVLLLFIFVTAIIGIQLLPTLELIGKAARVSQNYTFLINNLLIQPYQLFVLLIPDMFGNPATRNYLLSDSYPGNAMYVGVLPLLFACYSLVKIKTEKTLLFFASASAVLLVMLVRSPFTQLLYKLQIPFFSTGSPSNALYLISFCVAILAGFGLEYFIQSKNKHSFIVGVGLLVIVGSVLSFAKVFHLDINTKNTLFTFILLLAGTFIVGLGTFLPKKKTVIIWAIILLTVFDLSYFFQKFNPFVNASLIYPPVPVVSKLQSIAGSSRVWSYGEGTIESNVLSVYHVQDPNGYDPLYPKIYGEFISSSEDGKIQTEFNNQSRSDAVIASAFHQEDLEKNPYRFRLLDATSVGFILSKEVLSPDFLQKHQWKLAFSQDGWNIYRNLSALPHAYMVNSYETYTTPGDFSQKFYTQDFDIHTSVLLEKGVGSLSHALGSVMLKTYSAEKVVLQTNTNGKNLLVLTDTFFPGWKAFIDGKETPILKANFTYRAVVVPQGVHTIVFSYQPLSFSIGLTLTIMGLAGFILFLIVKGRSKLSYE